ncbi:MAG TPA: ester cyclase [Anaerolineales bacterium]|nr:ester cyclase [Anaerolineales bacterium]
MSTEQNKAAARLLIEKGFNQKDLTAFDAYFSPRLKDHALPPGLPEGLEGRKMFASVLFAAFPDMHFRIEDMFTEGDKLVARWSAHGTHTGELMGIPPTGKKVSIGGIAIDHFENGQSVELWEIFDQLGLMQQLGVIPMS